LIPEIVSIAKAVGARVIAEGMEKEEQRRVLMDFGVEFGQGHLFAMPMEIDAFADFSAQSRRVSQSRILQPVAPV
jgi:EAL domain-containing protein (putative c-di-GMP-specific phosphodiesterase class I)